MTLTENPSTSAVPGGTDFAAARRAMIDSQLRTSGVNEPFVLNAMNRVAREDHVPAAARSVAYMDRAVPLGDGHALPGPLFHGRALAEARPVASDRALVVDSGAGYLPALLSGIVQSVETITPAQATAGRKPKGLGDFTLLMIDGAIEELPPMLGKLLADDARIVTGLVERGVSRIAVGRASGGKIALMRLAEMGIPRLAEFDREEAWSF
mgnify:CR=1 FL=1